MARKGRRAWSAAERCTDEEGPDTWSERIAVSRELQGTLAVLAAAAGYGTLAVLVKLALAAGALIWPLVAWRFVIGAALVWAYVLVARRPLPPRRKLAGLLLLGFLYCGDAVAYLVGLQWVPAATASLVFFTYPAVVVLLSAAFLGEPLTPRRVVALALTVGGCMLTAGAGLHGGEPRGLVLILVGVVFIAVFVVASRPVLEDAPALSSSAFTLLATALLTVAVAFLVGGRDGMALGGGPRAAVLTGLVGLLATALPVTLFLTAVKLLGPGKAAIYSTLEPAFTVVLAAWLLAEPISGGQLVGGSLILVGVLWLRAERAPGVSEPVQLESP